jgi:hypothetical protein
MSCASFTVLSLLIASFAKDARAAKKWLVRGTAILAICFYGLASLLAWIPNIPHICLPKMPSGSHLSPQKSSVLRIPGFPSYGVKNILETTLWISISNHGLPGVFANLEGLSHSPK